MKGEKYCEKTYFAFLGATFFKFHHHPYPKKGMKLCLRIETNKSVETHQEKHSPITNGKAKLIPQ